VTDATNAPVPAPEADPAAQPATGRTAFLGTNRGRLIAVVAVVVLLVIAGVAAAALFLFGGSLLSGGDGDAFEPIPKAPVSATTTSAASVPIENPPQKPLSASFTFRNVFAPTIMPPAAEATTAVEPEPQPPADTGNGSTTESTTPEPTSTLTLTDIITEGDAHKGVFSLDGTTYTAGNGETLGSSPWKVIEVGSDSVLMLYGDSQVTISIGQGITK